MEGVPFGTGPMPWGMHMRQGWVFGRLEVTPFEGLKIGNPEKRSLALVEGIYPLQDC